MYRLRNGVIECDTPEEAIALAARVEKESATAPPRPTWVAESSDARTMLPPPPPTIVPPPPAKPSNVARIVDVMSDNKRRTIEEVMTAVSRDGFGPVSRTSVSNTLYNQTKFDRPMPGWFVLRSK
jgi:hypothetical protein